MLNDAVLFRGNHLAELVLKIPCPQKILMVADSSLNFNTGMFGLSEFVSIITGAGHTVSTAHRSGTAPVTIAGAYNFATAATAVTTANYDQIWLFGFSNTPLTAAEQTGIANFMKNGGGVFATGDHETIGRGMGNNIPRVRSMRNWSTIPMTNPMRHDTVVNPGLDGIKQFDDQADIFPQQIYPVFFSNGGPQNDPTTWKVHPVLHHKSGAVDFLPDHAHESECLAPTPVAGNFAGVEEWPTPVGGGPRIPAQVVAVSISAGRFITDSLKPPVLPRCFGAISAYDGDAAKVGRIVCDATWHHFVNINLNGAGADADTSGVPRAGMYVGGMPTPEYLKIQRYYLNTVRWLAPIGRRLCWPFIIAAALRFDAEVLELQLPEPHPCPWDPLVRIGLVVEEALTRHWGPGMLEELVDDILLTTGAAPALSQVLKSRRFAQGGEQEKPSETTLLPLQELRRAVFGSIVNLLARELPEDEKPLARVIRGFDDDSGNKLLVEGLRGAQQSMTEYLGRALDRAGAEIKALSVVATTPRPKEETKRTARRKK
jgi:hypothetical protein